MQKENVVFLLLFLFFSPFLFFFFFFLSAETVEIGSKFMVWVQPLANGQLRGASCILWLFGLKVYL